MRAIVLGVVVLAAGCFPRVEPDAPSVTDGGPINAFGVCVQPLEGTAGFSTKVEGTVRFLVQEYQKPDRVESDTVSFDVYFPRGLQPGAPAVLWSPVYRGHQSAVSTLDAAGMAKLDWRGIVEFRGLSAQVQISRDGAWIDATQNFAPPESDVMVEGRGSGRLCPSSGTASGELKLAAPWKVGPLSVPMFDSSVPLDESTVTATAMRAATAGPLSVSARAFIDHYLGGQRDVILLEPHSPIPPNQDLELDVSAVRDVLGRPVGSRLAVPSLKTTATLSDLSFEDLPPPGAIDSTCNYFVSDGRLVIGENDWCGGDNEVLIALPDAAAATRVRVVFVTDYDFPTPLTAAVVRADGAESKTVWIPREGATDLEVELPAGSGPCWLDLGFKGVGLVPQWLSGPPVHLVVDEIVLE